MGREAVEDEGVEPPPARPREVPPKGFQSAGGIGV